MVDHLVPCHESDVFPLPCAPPLSPDVAATEGPAAQEGHHPAADQASYLPKIFYKYLTNTLLYIVLGRPGGVACIHALCQTFFDKSPFL